MAIKAIVTPYFAQVKGPSKLISLSRLPRHNKQELELTVAKRLLAVLSNESEDEFREIRVNENDPPDVLFEYNGITIGIELTELVPRNRHEKDAVLHKLREKVLNQIELGEHTRDKVIFLHLRDNYADKLPLRNCEQQLANLLNKSLKGMKDGFVALDIPAGLRDVFRAITIETINATEYTGHKNDKQPLLIFPASATFIVPDEDFPDMLAARLGKKLRYDLAFPTWLLLWSDNQAMFGVRKELIQHIRKYLQDQKHNFNRIFYLSLSLVDEAMELELEQLE